MNQIKRISFGEGFMFISLSLFLVVLAITPVGGWSKSNPNRDLYMILFTFSVILSFSSIANLQIQVGRQRAREERMKRVVRMNIEKIKKEIS